MDKNTHVYCTNCVYFDSLLASVEYEISTPERCINCYPWDFEDSKPFYERPNYIERVDGLKTN